MPPRRFLLLSRVPRVRFGSFADITAVMEFVCFVPISDKVQQRVCRYSMTSSARPISAFGTMRPNALAVLRLITNSYLVGACIECDFKIPSGIGEVIDLTLLVEDIGRSSLAIAIVCHRDNIERLRARMVTAMMSLETKKAVPMPHGLREAIESYRRRTAAGAK